MFPCGLLWGHFEQENIVAVENLIVDIDNAKGCIIMENGETNFSPFRCQKFFQNQPYVAFGSRGL